MNLGYYCTDSLLGDDVVDVVGAARKGQAGRHYAMTDAKQAEYLERIREGDGRDLAAHNIKVSPTTVRAFRQRVPSFEQEMIDAESVSICRVERAAFQNALNGDRVMQIFLLTNLMSEKYKDRRGPTTLQQINTAGPVEYSLAEARAEAHQVLDELAARRAQNEEPAIDAASEEQ